MGFPSLYIQGWEILNLLPQRMSDHFECRRAAVIVDPAVEGIFSTLQPHPVLAFNLLKFGGSCTRREVNRLCVLARAQAPDIIVGAGGGQALDTAKAVSLELALPLVIVPTVASSDAPTSRLIAIYDENHKITEVPTMKRNPDLIYVDTSILIKAPRRLFVAGMGDAFTKRYEVKQAAANTRQRNYFGGLPPELSAALAQCCHQALMEHGAAALQALDSGVPNDGFDRVVEASILYSGLAFESGGLSVAHGMLRGLTACSQTHAYLHGELVSYGLLVQLHAFHYDPPEILEATRFLKKAGLPVSRKDIGLAAIETSEVMQIAELTLSAPYLKDSSQPLTAKQIFDAMLAVERTAGF